MIIGTRRDGRKQSLGWEFAGSKNPYHWCMWGTDSPYFNVVAPLKLLLVVKWDVTQMEDNVMAHAMY